METNCINPLARTNWQSLNACWQWLLDVALLVFTARFAFASSCTGQPASVPLVLLIGPAVVGAWRPKAGLFACCLLLPVLGGLGQCAIVQADSPVLLVISGYLVGAFVRRACTMVNPGRTPIGHHNDLVLFAVNSIATAIVISAVVQLWSDRRSIGVFTELFGHPVFGYGSSLYFVTSAFVWLQGASVFRGLYSNRECLPALMSTLVSVLAAVMLLFLCMQWLVALPDSYLTFYWSKSNEPGRVREYFAPFEDIHSFGSFAMLLWCYAIAFANRKRGFALFFHCTLGLLALIFITVSWSRITWAAAVVMGVIGLCLKVKARYVLIVCGLLVFCILFLNYKGSRMDMTRTPYLWRIVSLVRVESLLNKDAARVHLYGKALTMIKQRPFCGFGIGSFYKQSVRFAKSDDIYGSEPNFAHDVLLQLGAEMGAPVALLFIGTIGYVLVVGARAVIRGNQSEVGRSVFVLSGYLVTQITANSLNIYLTHQVLFWLLLCFVLGSQSTEKVTPFFATDKNT